MAVKKQVAPALRPQEQRALFKKMVNMNCQCDKVYHIPYQKDGVVAKPRFASETERQQHLELMWQQRIAQRQTAPVLRVQEQQVSKNAKITVYHFSKKKHQWQKTKEKTISFS